MPAKSKKQARFLGAVISGQVKKKSSGLSKAEAREMLRGTKLKKLPKKVKRKK